jgi:hypothetical protein
MSAVAALLKANVARMNGKEKQRPPNTEHDAGGAPKGHRFQLRSA